VCVHYQKHLLTRQLPGKWTRPPAAGALMLNLGIGRCFCPESAKRLCSDALSGAKRIVKIKRCDASVMNERIYVKLRATAGVFWMRCEDVTFAMYTLAEGVWSGASETTVICLPFFLLCDMEVTKHDDKKSQLVLKAAGFCSFFN
jgi:hypothetical protein